ncbi:PGPGW domain-containing protein [Alteromonas sp. ASW11-130]|uniref:PGPGW domain-containing protein n=1 Tax=Alteromonas sp. ASW11-130 TaxID=3015775 RepID=UPI0022425F41|nr:PGPGW domain-containing protein [Alteromonas sp. ASW11-130]MCW8090216.1 serine incorporator domain-containing protein [Alteromonas sp. ASW11-130]
MKIVRTIIGGALVLSGIVLTIVPGSTLFILAGLVLLSVDFPRARSWLKHCQTGMSNGARKLDRYLLARKLR